MNKDEMKGKAEQAKGYIKDNPDLETEGEAERAAGKLREGYGTAKRKAGEAVDETLDDE